MRKVNFAVKKAVLFMLTIFLTMAMYGCAPLDNEATSHYDAGERKKQMSMEDTKLWYYYNHLTTEEKIWYEDIYLTLKNMETDRELYPGNIESIGLEGIKKIFNCVTGDHPEIFYVDGYTYTHYAKGGKIKKVVLSGVYTMEKTQRDLNLAKLDSKARYILQDLSETATEYEKVRFVYEYVIKHTTYERDSVDNQNICSVLLHGKSVCQGYAKTVQYLLQHLGMEAALVNGSVYNGEGHAFDLVKVDGEYYYVDATWGDASYQSEALGETNGYLPDINYEYLCVDTKTITMTHTIDTPLPMPVCSANEANYYIMENAYFESYEESKVKEFVEKRQQAGEREIAIKCADKQVYEKFYEELIAKQKIFSFLSGSRKRVAYTVDDRKYSLTFWLENE